MKKVVKVSANNEMVTLLDVPEEFDYRWMAKQIGCDWIEIVHPRKLEEGFVLVVDEEGFLKENYLNVVGSWLYGTEDHGEPIAGDLLIMKEVYDEDGADLDGMTEEEAKYMKSKYGDINSLLEWAKKILDRLEE